LAGAVRKEVRADRDEGIAEELNSTDKPARELAEDED
jgi:hypothetical protein